MLDEFGAVIAQGGAGVVIASMAGTMAAGQLPPEGEGALALTPADQLRVQAASLTWGKRGARVNSISPGVISTPMGQAELSGESGAMMQGMIDVSVTGRIGTPSDIAEAAAFLLGPSASFITGTDLLVDGGVIAAVRSGAMQLPTA